MVRRSIEAALAARSISRVVVSSDDPHVLEIAHGIDAQLALSRPTQLATDTAAAVGYVRHALSALVDGDAFEAVVIVQPTSPFTSGDDIDRTVELLRDTGSETAVTVMKLDHAIHPLKLKEMDSDGVLLPYFEEERGRMAVHELPDLYVRNGSVYATLRRVIERGQIIGNPCVGHVMPRERSLDINDEFDLRFAEFLLTQDQA